MYYQCSVNVFHTWFWVPRTQEFLQALGFMPSDVLLGSLYWQLAHFCWDKGAAILIIFLIVPRCVHYVFSHMPNKFRLLTLIQNRLDLELNLISTRFDNAQDLFWILAFLGWFNKYFRLVHPHSWLWGDTDTPGRWGYYFRGHRFWRNFLFAIKFICQHRKIIINMANFRFFDMNENFIMNLVSWTL